MPRERGDVVPYQNLYDAFSFVFHRTVAADGVMSVVAMLEIAGATVSASAAVLNDCCEEVAVFPEVSVAAIT